MSKNRLYWYKSKRKSLWQLLVYIHCPPPHSIKFNRNLSSNFGDQMWMDEWMDIQPDFHVFIHWSIIQLILNCFSIFENNSKHWEHVQKKHAACVRARITKCPRSLIPGRGSNCCICYTPVSPEGPTQFQWVLGSVLLEMKQPEHEADHSNSSSAQV